MERGLEIGVARVVLVIGDVAFSVDCHCGVDDVG